MFSTHIKLVRWLLPDGAHVHPGQALCEIETIDASATQELESSETGILRHLYPAGVAFPADILPCRIDPLPPANPRL